MATPFEVRILGCNSASFAWGRHHTAQLVNYGQAAFLIDCGEGTQIQLQRYKLKPFRISHIFISHLHGDHYLGLPGLLGMFNLSGRTAPLTIVGPPGLDEIITLHFKVSNTQLNYPLSFIASQTDDKHLLFTVDNLDFYSFPLDHRLPTTGFLIQERTGQNSIRLDSLPAWFDRRDIPHLLAEQDYTHPETGQVVHWQDVVDVLSPPRSYAYCSDTAYTGHVHEHVMGVTMLYHEATFGNEMLERATKTYHSTTLQAATVAQQANAGKLLIGHYSSRYKEIKPLLDEARSVFRATEAAQEGERYNVAPYQLLAHAASLQPQLQD